MIWSRIKLIVSFYRQFLLVSFVVNFALVYFDLELILAIVGKAMLAGLVYWIYCEGQSKYEFDFYRNLRIDPMALFCWSFLMDAFLLVLVYLIVDWI